MRTRSLVIAAAVAALAVLVPAAARPAAPIYLDPSYSFSERAADLVSRLTLAQKASQMNSSVSVAIASPVAIAQYGWWNEAAHGVMCESLTNNQNCTNLTNTTSYPVALSMAASWDPALIHDTASLISDEAREVETNNTQNMDFYAPVINLMRDPRWGRSDETWSEDPYLEAKSAGQFVNGLQGQDMNGNLDPAGAGAQGFLKAIATIKHYTANNSEVNRLNGSSDMDERSLREYYTRPYRDIAREAHVGSVMSSYNKVNGTPSPANVYLTDTLLRETFGFQGYMTSDCDAIYTMQNYHHWVPPIGPAVTASTRHAWALAAGEDLDCNTGYHDSNSYANQLVNAVNANITTTTGLLTENQVDTSLLRLFTARMQLGEFDNGGNDVPWVQQARARVPQGSWQNDASNMAVTETAARLSAARQAGARSIVLLKNDPVNGGKLLPLQVPATGPFVVQVIGFFANPGTTGDPLIQGSMYLGDYSSSQEGAGVANEVNGFMGLRAAIQAINPAAVVDWCSGVTGGVMASMLTTVDPTCVNSAAAANAVIVYVGTDSSTGKEGQDRANISLPGAQASLISQVVAANPKTIVY
ncbi:MAG: beta-glucosidase, partial [Thermoleophilales bacterium]|nr:beta-glucosidase [Thermoleophilales bacterium]